MTPLSSLFDGYLSETVTLESFVCSFVRRTRSLLDDEDIIEQGTLRIDTSHGANLSGHVVRNALRLRDQRKKPKAVEVDNLSPFAQNAAKRQVSHRQRDEEKKNLETLAPARKIMRSALDASRDERRAARRSKAVLQRQVVHGQ